MLIPNQEVEMTWGRNKEYYINRGYKYSGFRKIFKVKVKDLNPNSKKKVTVQCDNCGAIYKIPYREYIAHHSEKYGDLCFSCCHIKTKDTCMKKYGAANPSQVKEFQQKRTATILEKYGVENAFQSEDIKNKIKATCKEKYGYEIVSQSPLVQERIKQTCLKKYGVSSPAKNDAVKEKTANTCLKKYGGKSSMSSSKVRAKAMETMCKNGTVPSSKQQHNLYLLLCDMFGKENCIENYPYDRIAFDILVEIDDIKFDVEYDGEYWHHNKQKYDNKRNRFVISRGFKVLRFKGNYEIPTKDIIEQEFDYLVKGNHDYAEYYLDTKMNK